MTERDRFDDIAFGFCRPCSTNLAVLIRETDRAARAELEEKHSASIGLLKMSLMKSVWESGYDVNDITALEMVETAIHARAELERTLCALVEAAEATSTMADDGLLTALADARRVLGRWGCLK